MIGCEYYLEMMSAFMDGELDEEMRAELSEHLRSCSGCFNAALAYKAINESMEDSETEPPENFSALVMNKVHMHKKKVSKRPWQTFGALAAAVIFVVITAIAAPSIFSSKDNSADTAGGDSGDSTRSLLAGKSADDTVAENAELDNPEEEGTSNGLVMGVDDPDTAPSDENNDSATSYSDSGTGGAAQTDGSTEAPDTETLGDVQMVAPDSIPAYTSSDYENNGTPIEINGYPCSAIIVLDPDVTPPDVFDQYTYYSWQESSSLYLIISADLYDELIDCLKNLDISYNLELYSEITSDGWILLITAAK